MFTYDRWTVLSYVNIGKIHIYMHEHIALLSYKSCMNFRKRSSSEEITHLVKFPDMCAFSTLIGWNLSLRFAAIRRPPRIGDAWIKLRMSVFGSWMELVSSLRSAAVSRAPRATLRQGMRLSGTWVFFPGLEPHVICEAYAVAAHNHVTYSMKSTLGCICTCKSYNNF